MENKDQFVIFFNKCLLMLLVVINVTLFVLYLTVNFYLLCSV